MEESPGGRPAQRRIHDRASVATQQGSLAVSLFQTCPHCFLISSSNSFKSPEWCIIPEENQPGPEHGGWPTEMDPIGYCWVHIESMFAGLRNQSVSTRENVDMRHWPNHLFTVELMKNVARNQSKPYDRKATLARRLAGPPPTPKKFRTS